MTTNLFDAAAVLLGPIPGTSTNWTTYETPRGAHVVLCNY